MKVLVAVAVAVGINGFAKSIKKHGSVQGSMFMGLGNVVHSLVPFWVK